MTKRFAAVLCAGFLLAACEPTDIIEDLGSLGGKGSIGFGINKGGNVTGVSWGAQAHSGYHAFRYVDGLGMIDVGALPNSDLCWGDGISDSGLVVGMCLVSGGDFLPNAFIATATLALTNIGTPDIYSYARDVNDKAQVTGEADFELATHAFIWTRSGGMQDLGTLGGPSSYGRAINAGGQVAGESGARDGNIHAFRLTQGAGMIDLGTLGGSYSSADGINDSGQVVGTSSISFRNRRETFLKRSVLTDPFSGMHAFLWTEGVGMIDLGTLGGNLSGALAINNQGVVVGSSTLASGAPHAFRWTREGGMIDLNTLLPCGSGWLLTHAHDVNDKGQITGEGLHSGKTRAFRMNPGPVPTLPPMSDVGRCLLESIVAIVSD